MSNNIFFLPFDHRASFSRDLLKISGTPDLTQSYKISYLKNLIYLAFLNVQKSYGDDKFAILIDEQYGENIIKSAKELKINFAVSVEKSGKDIFEFEHGDSFFSTLDEINPTYAKALVRYNPQNVEDNKIQLQRLSILSDYCRKSNIKFLFELLVPPTNTDLNKSKSKEEYDSNIRPMLTKKAIEEIKEYVKVDLWKIEGMNSSEDWKYVLTAIDQYEKIIVLGRGENIEGVKTWLYSALPFENIVGFAIGRTIFFNPLHELISGISSEEICIKKIEDNFRFFIDFWLSGHKK